MTLPTSGPITFANIQTEFGGSNPISISEYYNGGGLVPSGTAAGSGSETTAPLSSTAPSVIPTSGVIQISQFFGTSAIPLVTFPVTSSAVGCSQGNFPTGTTNCHVTLNSDGTISHGGGGGATSNHYSGPTNWASPTGSYGSVYQFVITNVNKSLSGTASPSATGTFGTGLNMSISIGPGQANSVTYTITIQRISDLASMGSFTVGLDLDNT